MNLILRSSAAACLLAAAATIAQAKIERVVEKTFTVQPGGTLRVLTQGGTIRVLSSPDPTVKVVAKEKIKAGSEAEADEMLKKLTLTLEQEGNDVTASASYEKGSFKVHFGSWPPVEVDFVVTVPSRYSADLKTSGGDIVVGDLDGTVHARTSGGDVKLGKISGEVAASSSGGNLVLVEGGAEVHLSTSGGNIRVDRSVGAADLRTSGGDIDVKSAENTLNARTSGGDVTARIAGPVKGDCDLRTSGGRVKALVSPGAGFRLEAATSGGSVDAEGLTITIDRGGHGRSSLSGSVNGGGPTVRLRSSGGDIIVRTSGA